MKLQMTFSWISSLKYLFPLAFATLFFSSRLFAAEVTLAWDPSPDAGVGSYRVHYGTTSGSYTSSTNAGLATTVTVTGLTEGTTYYFAATAVGTNQLESDFSNEISYTVPLPVNQPPTITAIGDQTIDEDAVAGPISVTVGDAESPALTLTLTGSSSNPTLVPDANIVFGGSGSSRTVTVTPLANASGIAQITVAVSDGDLSTTQQFALTVNSVNDAPTLSSIGNQTVNEDGSIGPLSFTVGDLETPATALTLSGTSSNPSLVPDGNIVFGGSGSSRTVTVTPLANASGIAQITVAVSDGDLSASRPFTLTVNSVNDVPTVTSLSNQTLDEDTATGPLSFTVGDVETAAASLIVSGASSNPTLVPDANITFGGSGANRTVTVSPAANQSGTAQITVSVSDGTATVTSAFTLTVNSVNDAPTITSISNQTLDEDTTTGPISFTLADVDNAASTLTLSGSSSNPSLVPDANIVFEGSDTSRAVTVSPVANGFGTAQITVTVSDSQLTNSRSFTLTVNAVNDAPTLASLNDVNVVQDSGEQTVNLTGIGTGAANESQTLSVSASSSDPTVVPDPVVDYTSPASTGSLRFTPVAGKSGSVTVMVTVTDSGGTANGGIDSVQRSFTVNVTPPENTPPTITLIGNQTINEDAVAGPIGFTIGDAQSTADSLTLSGVSSNPSLVPDGNIVFGGTGANRTVTLTPLANASGSAQITVAVSDGELSATRQFTLTVNSVNDVPTVTSISNQTIDEDTATGPLSFTVGDVETAAGSLFVNGASSNPTLVPNARITFGGSGATRTVTVSPSANQSGTAQITVSVSDGTATVTSAFTLTVNSVNDAPTITSISDQTIDEDTTAGPISFTLADVDDAVGTLTVSGSSSNPSLVPDANIVFAGTFATRTVTITPVANGFGTAQITVTVSDGQLTDSRTFTLTVNSVEDPPTPPGNLRLAVVPAP